MCKFVVFTVTVIVVVLEYNTIYSFIIYKLLCILTCEMFILSVANVISTIEFNLIVNIVVIETIHHQTRSLMFITKTILCCK
jgi:hypothetical protein